jgi:hypothetical protein
MPRTVRQQVNVKQQGLSVLVLLCIWCCVVTWIYTRTINSSLVKLEEDARFNLTRVDLEKCKESNQALQASKELSINALKREHDEKRASLTERCTKQYDDLKNDCNNKERIHKEVLHDAQTGHDQTLEFMFKLSENYLKVIDGYASSISTEAKRLGFLCQRILPQDQMGDGTNQLAIYKETSMVCDVGFHINKHINYIKETSLTFNTGLENIKKQPEVKLNLTEIWLRASQESLFGGGTAERGTAEDDTAKDDTSKDGMHKDESAKGGSIETSSGYLPAVFNNQVGLRFVMAGAVIACAVALPKKWRDMFTLIRSSNFKNAYNSGTQRTRVTDMII